ncbi:YbgC/FadM family acyl-CoA thioesterase [Campylobacter aviculae]|uniref:Acyl-CoA thioester hydrolase n=1 Tax=Campylobacter aviculae TaxID=2510190 RepID=A0A4U7BLZ5_9BACT|nr:YbgC/FadM family acyl-CoA thioesterase [Campylobacter aviculae]TKX31180.1 acyl-CoA thioester hydrolase [Campylobacter aviculae]
MKIRIYYEDTDAGGVVYHSNYLKFCERARSEVLFSKNAQIFDASTGHFFLTSVNCKFIKPAKLGDIVEVKTKIMEIKTASIEILQEIYKDEHKIFRMNGTLAYVREGKPVKMDLEIKKLFEELF